MVWSWRLQPVDLVFHGSWARLTVQGAEVVVHRQPSVRMPSPLVSAGVAGRRPSGYRGPWKSSIG